MLARMRVLALVLGVGLLAACGGGGGSGKPEGDPSVVGQPNPEGTAPANTEPGPAPAIEQPVRKRRPYEIVNLCPTMVTLIYGEDPKAANAPTISLGGNARIEEGPRDKDGNQIVWLVVRGDPLVKVRVSKGTKRVEIGTSCDTLEMH